jgi:quinol monooxygenase YgiN
MASLLAHLRVTAGREAEFEAIIGDLWRATHHHESSVVHYEYWRGQDERTYYTLLCYPDEATFLDHQTSAHHDDAAVRFAGVIESIRLEWLQPVPGASNLAPSRPHTLDDDVSDERRRTQRRFGVQLASWWGSLAE